MKLKRWAVAALSLWMAAAGRAGGLPDGSPEQERGLLVRVGAGLASANLEGTGESCWRRPKDKGERGFQYSVDVADWRRNWGYGLTFKHYTNGSAFAGSGGETEIPEKKSCFTRFLIAFFTIVAYLKST